MREFFKLYDKMTLMCLEVGHSSITDWNIYVYDGRGKSAGNWGNAVISVQECDINLAFAKAYVALADYASEHLGGY